MLRAHSDFLRRHDRLLVLGARVRSDDIFILDEFHYVVLFYCWQPVSACELCSLTLRPK